METFGELPCLVSPSVGGQVPYLTRDQQIPDWPRAVGADDLVEVMDAFKKSGAASFDELLFRTKPPSASILVPHEILRFADRYREAKKSGDIRAGGTTMKEAPLWAPSGKNLTTPTQYMEIARAVKPSVVQLLSDIDFDYRQPLSKKRFEKAFKRSESWIEQQIESDSDLAKLVPVLFHSDLKILGYHINNLVKTADSSVIGFVLQGLDSRIVKDPFAQLSQQVALLPSKGVKICFDFFTPHDIVKGVQCGISVFGGHWATMMADSHVGVILPTPNHPARKLRLLDVTQEALASDKSTICEDSAVEYSVGYIHHLFKVRELLEPILLTKHNMEQMELFIQLIRSVKNEPSRLCNLLELVKPS